MQINFGQAEDLEMFLASEFVDEALAPFNLENDSYEVGYKILDILSCDLALGNGILNPDELS